MGTGTHTSSHRYRHMCQIDCLPKPVWSKSSQVILAPDIIHFSVSGPFKPFSMNTGRKSPMCAEQSLECETWHGLTMEKELPFQNKANIWVFPGCTIPLVHKCLQSSLIHRFGARVNVSANFMVQLSKICKLYETGHCGSLIKHHSCFFSSWRNVDLVITCLCRPHLQLCQQAKFLHQSRIS